jgi:curved DNA-binding protein CbpA
MKKLNAAYELLRDADRRTSYDRAHRREPGRGRREEGDAASGQRRRGGGASRQERATRESRRTGSQSRASRGGSGGSRGQRSSTPRSDIPPEGMSLADVNRRRRAAGLRELERLPLTLFNALGTPLNPEAEYRARGEHYAREARRRMARAEKALKARDAAIRARDAAIRSRDEAAAARDAAFRERDAARRERDVAISDYDAVALKRERDWLHAQLTNAGESLAALADESKASCRRGFRSSCSKATGAGRSGISLRRPGRWHRN